jgi:site-specific DNA recombinase
MIYCYMRYSSDGQTGGVSIEMQTTAVQNFIKSNVELRGQQVLNCCDEAKSGTSLNGRESLARIRRNAVKGDTVLVYKLDRLGRNLHDALQVLRDLEGRGVRIMSATEPEMPLARHMLLAFAEEFSRQLSDRCKRSLDSIAAKGGVANGAACLSG